MERIFMASGIITAIVLFLVGVIKSPFEQFKKSRPKIYKAIFTVLSIVISVIVSIIDEIYIAFGEICSMDFAIKTIFVIAGVFCGYGGIYEGLGVKDLLKVVMSNIEKAIEQSKQNKKDAKKNDDEDEINEV